MYGHIEYRVNVHKVVQQQVGFYMHFLTIIGNMGKLLNIRIPKGKFYFITWSNRTESGSIEARAVLIKRQFSLLYYYQNSIQSLLYSTQEAGTSEIQADRFDGARYAKKKISSSVQIYCFYAYQGYPKGDSGFPWIYTNQVLGFFRIEQKEGPAKIASLRSTAAFFLSISRPIWPVSPVQRGLYAILVIAGEGENYLLMRMRSTARALMEVLSVLLGHIRKENLPCGARVFSDFPTFSIIINIKNHTYRSLRSKKCQEINNNKNIKLIQNLPIIIQLYTY
eukprot:TRINITY_DN2279_c0_g1_i4.p1 TRINITY_DN2279_c0_g1~~TRINITY_DN2279_c0_g1_i4.p1  ORF type:complete len:280 (-),score=-12.47 TRINITY_DN2279_c0_g1_i4:26-865(-)